MNVARLPFSLRLILRWDPVQPLTNALFHEEYFKRIFSLHLTDIPRGWLSSFSKLEKLNTLRIDEALPFPTDREFSLAEVPSLRKLCIKHLNQPIELPSLTLTSLDLSDVPIDTCVTLLIQCPNLVRFRSSNPKAHEVSRFPDSPAEKAPLILQYLEDFSWTHGEDARAEVLIRRIQLPGLRRFSWDEQSNAYDFRQTFLSVIPNISGALTILTLKHLPSWDCDLVEQVLKQFPNIERLSLRTCHVETITVFICKLAWIPDEPYLPSLTALTIDNCYDPRNWELCGYSRVKLGKDAGWDILKIFASRFEAGVCTRFCFELKNVSVKWGPHVRKALRELVSEGFDLEVIDDVKVDWLVPTTEGDGIYDDGDEDEDEDKEDDDEEEDDDNAEEDDDLDNYEVTASDLEC